MNQNLFSVKEWTKLKGLPILGIPFYVASGSHVCNGVKYRFLVLPRYEKDLEGILEEKKKFNLKTVLLISKQILQVLEYIHDKGYIHSDIKAANIMLNQVKTNSKRKCLKSKVKKQTEVCSARYKRYDTRPVKHINYNLDQLFDDYSFGFQDESSLLGKGKEKTKIANVTGDQVMIMFNCILDSLIQNFKLSHLSESNILGIFYFYNNSFFNSSFSGSD